MPTIVQNKAQASYTHSHLPITNSLLPDNDEIRTQPEYSIGRLRNGK